SGAAGAALGLLALHRRRPEPHLLERAAACGDHVMSTGRGCWVTVVERPVAGLSHGSSGIALALRRLAGATGRADFEEAAQEALAWERSLFDPTRGNWPDLRSDPPRWQANWCNGAAGGALARLAMGDPALAPEVE